MARRGLFKRRSSLSPTVNTNAIFALFIGFALVLLAIGLWYDTERRSSALSLDGRLVVERVDSQPLRVMFVGDSLNYGLFATTAQNGFRAVTVARLSETNQVEETSGDQIGGTAANLVEKSDFNSRQDLTVVEVGTNDVGLTELRDFESSYTSLLDKIQYTTDSRILCLGVWRLPDAGAEYDNVIAESCRARGGRYIALSDIVVEPGTRGPTGNTTFGGVSDDFHPNDRGHHRIAERILNSISVG